jgi:hypothetical protein
VSGARAALLALSLSLVWLAPSSSARAAVIYSYQAQPQGPSHGMRQAAVVQSTLRAPSGSHAPNGPPLTLATSPRAGESVAGVPSSEGDPLVDNGLSSPLCKGSTSSGLSREAQSDCRTSGFVAASAPTKSYEIDVNIDTGPLGLGKGVLWSVIQDVFVTPVWNALVWVVHALIVMLEWCYTLDLLGGPTMSGVAHALRQAQASFTQPWLALVLAAAAVLALYNGLVRRRVAETLGQALMTIAMMVAGLWVIADPLGTVGAVGQWANQASLGTLGAVARGTPANAPRTLADSMRAMFGDAIEMPWCYLEFGNVRWCRDPALLDQRLRKAGLLIEARQQAMIGCKPRTVAQLCAAVGSPAALTVEHSDYLMRQATTNGELFLAFPANGPERNSVTEEGSLLHVLCQTEDDTKCTGPTAAQAEFRSDSGTLPRAIGVIAIAVGVLGMAMLFGLIALRLFAAAIVSLCMLLLAPAAVLAPALGDGGRAVFGGWLTRLLGAVTSKLLYSFVLGVLLMMQRTLMSLQSLGWWTEWLLISAFWWAVFLKRHQAMALLQNRGREPAVHRRTSIAQRVGRALETPRAMSRPVRWATRKIFSPAVDEGQLRKRARASRNTARQRADEQVVRTLEHDHDEAGARMQAGPRPQARLSDKRAQLERVRRGGELALAGGDRRRAAKLAVRGQRIEGEIAREGRLLSDARRTIADGERARRNTGSAHTREQREKRARFLDEQAALPASSQRQAGMQRRDYAALAGLAGYEREQYERLDSAARRQARLRIDRELALRSQLGAAAQDVAHASEPGLGRRERRRVDREFDRALEQRVHVSGHPPPGSVPKRSAPDPYSRASRGAREQRSTVMDDARAVAERRKRQLGYGPNQ